MRTLKKPLKKALCLLAAGATLVVPYELATATAGTVWHPTADASVSWSWQLSGTPNLANHVQMYDIDGFDNTAATVSALHAQGTIAVCYIDFGTWENWRSDQASFPSSVLGSSNGWPGEKWLDVRQISTLAPIMTARMQMCVQKGFDALEPDNIDGFSNSTGFPITAADQLAYNEWIANTAHSLGLSVGLKNDVDQAAQLQPFFDWALDEQCNEYSECDTLSPFTAANKAVFNAEYGSSNSFCAADIAAHINGARFDLDLTGATDVPCGGWGTTAATTTTTGGATSTTAGSGGTSTTPAAVSTTSQPSAPIPSSTTSTTAQPTTSTTRRATTTTTNRATSGRGTNGTRRTTTTTTPRRSRRTTTTVTTVSASTVPFWHVGWWGHVVSGDGSTVGGSGASDTASATTADTAFDSTTNTSWKGHHHYWG